MKLTKKLAKSIIIPITLGILASPPLYASSKKQNILNYEKFIKEYNHGDRTVWLNKYLQKLNLIDDEGKIDAEKLRKAMDNFEKYDRVRDGIIDNKDIKDYERRGK